MNNRAFEMAQVACRPDGQVVHQVGLRPLALLSPKETAGLCCRIPLMYCTKYCRGAAQITFYCTLLSQSAAQDHVPVDAGAVLWAQLSGNRLGDPSAFLPNPAIPGNPANLPGDPGIPVQHEEEEESAILWRTLC